MKILVVEDDSDVAEYVELALQEAAYDTTIVGTRSAADETLDSSSYELILLDINLPGGSGLEIIKSLRQKLDDTPIIVVSSEPDVDARVKALDLGADDYVVKPFSYLELLARVRAVLRRRTEGPPLRLHIADLEMDLVSNQVTRGGKTVELTRQEFSVLECLLRFKDQIVTPNMLERDVWKLERPAKGMDNVIRVHISNLRNKIDNGAEVPLIHTVRGKGYSIRATNRG